MSFLLIVVHEDDEVVSETCLQVTTGFVYITYDIAPRTQEFNTMKIVISSLVSLFLSSRPSSAFCGTFFKTCPSLSFSATKTALHQTTQTKSSLFSTTSMPGDTSITLTGPELPPLSSQSKRLFLVRHGEVINPGGDKPVFYGCMDVKLSPLGEMEAKVSVLKTFFSYSSKPK